MSQSGLGTGGYGVVFEGLNEFRYRLRRVDRELLKKITPVHRVMALEARQGSEAEARRSKGGPLFGARSMWSHSATQAGAAVVYRKTNVPARVTGKNAAAVPMGWIKGSKRARQFSPWLGNKWTGGSWVERAIGTWYAVTPTFRRLEPKWVREYEKKVMEALETAR